MPDDWGSGKFNQGEDENFEIADVEMGSRDAEDIERQSAERRFKQIQPGVHELEIIGFFKWPPPPVSREVYVKGVKSSYHTHSIGVKLALPNNHKENVLDFFDLPPQDVQGLVAYQEGTKEKGGSSPGFLHDKFSHFIQRLGWPYPKGGKLPKEARNPKNWVGRRIIANIQFQKQDKDQPKKIDPLTGEPCPPQTQVELFSYRPSPTTTAGTAGAMGASVAPASPSAAHGQHAASGAPVASPATVGLDTI